MWMVTWKFAEVTVWSRSVPLLSQKEKGKERTGQRSSALVKRMKKQTATQLVPKEKENPFPNLCYHRGEAAWALQLPVAMALDLQPTDQFLVEIAGSLWEKEKARGRLQAPLRMTMMMPGELDFSGFAWSWRTGRRASS